MVPSSVKCIKVLLIMWRPFRPISVLKNNDFLVYLNRTFCSWTHLSAFASSGHGTEIIGISLTVKVISFYWLDMALKGCLLISNDF